MRLVMMAAAAVFAAGAAHAQTYPDKPIHVVVPFSPGSATDVTARALSQELSKKLGQPVVIDNRPGAGGTIGAAQVARAASDGYTLLVHSSGHTVNPSIFANLGYDTQKDLVGISMLAELPNVLVVPPSRGWKSAPDPWACRTPSPLSAASAMPNWPRSTNTAVSWCCQVETKVSGSCLSRPCAPGKPASVPAARPPRSSSTR